MGSSKFLDGKSEYFVKTIGHFYEALTTLSEYCSVLTTLRGHRP
jgi:hypothetical protein